MKYSKPKLRSILYENELRCANGSGASSSGCTTGGSVALACHEGSGDGLCWDGISTTSCEKGTSGAGVQTRCNAGYGPSGA
ncbi:MAG: hypothetical protein QXG00_07555 [Candidatus Woesearchaeota archaeon]